MASGLSQIHQQLMWNRLLAVVEEQAQPLLLSGVISTPLAATVLRAQLVRIPPKFAVPSL